MDKLPSHQRVTTTMTGSQKRQDSGEKQKRLSALQHDYN
jgi:hypothetical protein